MKIFIFLVLFTAYIVYSIVVYTRGTEKQFTYSKSEWLQINRGKLLFQQYNCTSCHQLYGLGGYLGPELTTAYSDKFRGELYIKAFLKNGGIRMPNFHFKEEDINALASFLKYVDTTAITYKDLSYHE
jgi:nitric oxide reductase subunit C